MRSLFSVGALLLAASTATTALPQAQNECLKAHAKALVLSSQTSCGDHALLSDCLASLPSLDPSALASCHVQAGCSAAQAASSADQIITNCQQEARANELRKRYLAMPLPGGPATQTAAAAPGHQLLARAATTPAPTKKGADCFNSKEFDTTKCDLETIQGTTRTRTCTPSKGTSSDCLKGWICTTDNTNEDICMKELPIDTGGIVVAIVFAAFIVIGIGYLTFACCRERSHHKKVAAKAEAVALARAATKKQRSQEARAPLMQQTQDNSGPNPFQDQPGHA